MDIKVLQAYATWSKQYLEQQIELSLKSLGIHGEKDIRDAKRVGDVTVINGDSTSYPAELYGKRERIISDIKENGYNNVIEEFAYTWFNRLVALRFMEVHGFIPHGFRVLSNPSGGIEPEILKNLGFVKGELKLDIALCEELKQQGKIEELFRYILTKQCNALSDQLPMLFNSDMGYLDLLLPQSLLKGDTVITRLVEIPEEVFLDDVEVIGWMYQFYISSKKDAVDASKKTITKDTLPAVTQLFTPDWIVRYMAENSVGRIWLESYSDSSLRAEMKYYVKDAVQTEEVQKRLDEIRYKNVSPEDLRIIEPCCGSGHILVYVFDLLFKMYEEKGYMKRDIPTLILKNNLVGLDVDKRASQLAAFSLIMKARSMNNRFFDKEYYEVPHVYEIKDSQLLINQDYRKQINELNLLSTEERELLYYLVETFENGKTIGSLLIVKAIDFDVLDNAIETIATKAVSNLFNIDFLERGVKRLKDLAQLAKILSSKYDVMITNPPYIGPSEMESCVKDYANLYYPNSKTDMFAMFMETGFVKENGFTSMINMQGWMSLSTYDDLRQSLVDKNCIVTLMQLGAHAFDTISGEIVQTASFVIRSYAESNMYGTYYDLQDGKSEAEKEADFFAETKKYLARTSGFKKIPGCPFTAYWASDTLIESFQKGTLIDVFGDARQGIIPGNVNEFVRLWFEVSYNKLGFNHTRSDEITQLGYKWFPYNKGGQFRKWAGNIEHVINMENNGHDIKFSGKNNNYRLREPELYFKEAVTWSKVSFNSFSVRYMPVGHLFDIAGCCVFHLGEKLPYVLGFMNSKVCQRILKITSPTTNFEVEHIKSLPVIFDSNNENTINSLVNECIELSQKEWNSYETSWNFSIHPLMLSHDMKTEAMSTQFAEDRIKNLSLISWHFKHWKDECDYRFNRIKENEEELNRIFIDIYSLEDELTPEVTEENITVRRADLQCDVKSFISYLVGIVMGRYSIDIPGLAYAGGEWDSSKYQTYQPDDDGIVPIYVGVGMEDGLTARIAELVKLIYGEESFKDNIDFIAETLGKANNESSMETINRYLNDGFYSDHLKTYQKRPIYWLFSSGKNKGFKCLVYMHRYNNDTLARINAKYYLPESTRQKIELSDIDERIKGTEGKERISLDKTRSKLFERYNETIEYGQVLDHMANKYIEINLDDGVKVNYAKFQGVELVSDSGVKIKKDLLVSLK